MIAIKSVPDGAQVYVDGLLTTATNGNIQGVTPGLHKLTVVKNGFVSWEKEIEVFEQLVTDITAILVSKTPSLEPLTSTGAKAPVISPSLSKIAYFTKDGTHPGVWIFPLADNQINLFKSRTDVALEDSVKVKYSNGQSIEWSPDEREILVKMDEKSYFIYELQSKTAQATTSAAPTKKRWSDDVLEKRKIFLARFSLPEDLNKIATAQTTIWSPDEKKFLYKEETADGMAYKVYDLEKPLPVGEKTNYTTFVVKKGEAEPKVYWYSDSFHLILVNGNVPAEKKGTIYLIRIDGTNKTEVYNNTLYSDIAFPTPGGDKIIVLTSFKSDGQTDLYATGIR